MRGVDWGTLYDNHRDTPIDTDAAEAETQRLIDDEDVQKQSGIYAYILTRDERHLRIRAFTPAMKRRAYEHQAGICTRCKETFSLAAMEADHIDPWSQGGKTTPRTARCCVVRATAGKGPNSTVASLGVPPFRSGFPAFAARSSKIQ